MLSKLRPRGPGIHLRHPVGDSHFGCPRVAPTEMLGHTGSHTPGIGHSGHEDLRLSRLMTRKVLTLGGEGIGFATQTKSNGQRCGNPRRRLSKSASVSGCISTCLSFWISFTRSPSSGKSLRRAHTGRRRTTRSDIAPLGCPSGQPTRHRPRCDSSRAHRGHPRVG